MVIATVKLTRRDPDRNICRCQQSLTLDLHLQYMAFHHNQLAPGMRMRQIFGAGIGLFVTHKVAQLRRVKGRLVDHFQGHSVRSTTNFVRY